MKTIMAIDLGKFKSVACYYLSGNHPVEYETIKTTPQAVHDLLVKYQPDCVVVEVCGIIGWVCDLVESLEIECKVANTNDERWQRRLVKRKTDQKDALKLARLEAYGELPLVYIPKPEVREKRALINYRKSLSGRITRIKNNIRAILDRYAVHLPSGKKGWSQKSIATIRAMARPFEKVHADELWRAELWMELALLEQGIDALMSVEDKLDEMNAKDKNVQLLQTVPGVGSRLAEAVSAYIDDPSRFKNVKQVGCYIGMTPRLYQSGVLMYQGRISKDGNSLLRSLLVEVCWLAMRWNPWVKETYKKIKRGSKTRAKIAIVATARRLFIRLWAMLRDGTVWQMPALEQAA